MKKHLFKTIILGSLIGLGFAFSSMAQDINFGRGDVLVKIPSTYSNSDSYPLVILLHGYTSSGRRIDNYFKVSDLVDDYDFLFVAPDGTQETTGRQNRFWNATDACCNFFESEVDDSGYIRSIIEEMQKVYNVDGRRIYLIGHSNGGFMSYRMAYEHSDKISAIVSLAGANHREQRDPPPNAVHILQIHGTNDRIIDFQGGDTREYFNGRGGRYPGALRSVRRWADYNGCAEAGAGRELRDLEASLPGHETGVLKFEIGCKEGGSAELWTIASGVHSPMFSDTFAAQVVEWLLAHPKNN